LKSILYFLKKSFAFFGFFCKFIVPAFFASRVFTTAQCFKLAKKFFLFVAEICWGFYYNPYELVTSPASMQVLDTLSFKPEHGMGLSPCRNIHLDLAVEGIYH